MNVFMPERGFGGRMNTKAKQKKSKTKQVRKRSPFLSVLTGSFAALLISLVLITVCALLLQSQTIGIESVKIINPVIKSISALAAALIASAKAEKRSWLTGLIAGFSASLLSFLIFSVLSGDFSIGTGTVLDFVMCSAAGMTGGILRSLVHNS